MVERQHLDHILTLLKRVNIDSARFGNNQQGLKPNFGFSLIDIQDQTQTNFIPKKEWDIFRNNFKIYLGQLTHDKYIFDDLSEFGGEVVYLISLAGLLFIDDGGYEGQVLKENETKVKIEKLELQQIHLEMNQYKVQVWLLCFGLFALFLSSCMYYLEYVKVKQEVFHHWLPFPYVGFSLFFGLVILILTALTLIKRGLK